MWLRELGVPFTLKDGDLQLTREGGHSHRRIVHAADATGAAVQRTLIEVARRTPNITFFEHHTLVGREMEGDGEAGETAAHDEGVEEIQGGHQRGSREHEYGWTGLPSRKATARKTAEFWRRDINERAALRYLMTRHNPATANPRND